MVFLKIYLYNINVINNKQINNTMTNYVYVVSWKLVVDGVSSNKGIKVFKDKKDAFTFYKDMADTSRCYTSGNWAEEQQKSEEHCSIEIYEDENRLSFSLDKKQIY